MNSYMQVADALARQNLETNAGGPFGACVVKAGEIIGQGSNQVLKSNDPTAHAEIVAIREACAALGSYDLSGCELYASCYPCPMCLAAIIWSNIKTVYYGNTKEEAAEIGFRDDFIYDFIEKLASGATDKAVLDFRSLDHDETIQAFQDFLRKEDKVIY